MPARWSLFVDSFLLAALSGVLLLFLSAFAQREPPPPTGHLREPLEMLVVHAAGCPRAREVHFIVGDGEILEAGVVYPQPAWDERRVIEHTIDLIVNGRSAAVRAPEGRLTGAVIRLGRTLGLPARPHREADGIGCSAP